MIAALTRLPSGRLARRIFPPTPHSCTDAAFEGDPGRLVRERQHRWLCWFPLQVVLGDLDRRTCCIRVCCCEAKQEQRRTLRIPQCVGILGYACEHGSEPLVKVLPNQIGCDLWKLKNVE
jgi:hypothetical protein